MARSVAVSGERLFEFLRQPGAPVTDVEVTSLPPSWAPLKPLLVRFVRAYEARGLARPVFAGVPLCVFGSEWSGFTSRPRTRPARGRCVPCQARDSCGFGSEVPDELLAISDAPRLQRWGDYAAAFHGVTGSDSATACTPFVERIMSAYRGPVSVDPSIVLSDGVQPSTRFVVFPHRPPTGDAAEAEHRQVLACIRDLLTELGFDRCDRLLGALGELAPLPLPFGMEECLAGSWQLKLYLRVEDKTPPQKQAVLDALSRSGASMEGVSASSRLQMLGLVLDADGLHTVKAYVTARPTRPDATAFPTPLVVDHPMARLTGDRALAVPDVWARGAPRASKWDFNVREHYLAGESAACLVAKLTSAKTATEVGPLLAGPTYRADIIAVGMRASAVALYIELN
jgi:hypothetical protein